MHNTISYTIQDPKQPLTGTHHFECQAWEFKRQISAWLQLGYRFVGIFGVNGYYGRAAA